MIAACVHRAQLVFIDIFPMQRNKKLLIGLLLIPFLLLFVGGVGYYSLYKINQRTQEVEEQIEEFTEADQQAIDDFEDALVTVCAAKAQADCIVTRDEVFLKAESHVKTVSPAELLSKLS